MDSASVPEWNEDLRVYISAIMLVHRTVRKRNPDEMKLQSPPEQFWYASHTLSYIIILSFCKIQTKDRYVSHPLEYLYIYIVVFYKMLWKLFWKKRFKDFWEKSFWVHKHNNARLLPFHIPVFFLYFLWIILPPWGFSWLLAGWHFPTQQALAVTGGDAGSLLLFTCCLFLQEQSQIYTNKTRENDLATHILNPLPLFSLFLYFIFLRKSGYHFTKFPAVVVWMSSQGSMDNELWPMYIYWAA